MLRWINPRVATIVLSVIAMVEVSKASTPEELTRRAAYVCAAMCVLYVLVFLVPLRRAVRPASLLGMLLLLVAGWGAVMLAMFAEAEPVTLEVRLQNHWNWPRTAFVLAAAVAFYLLFRQVTAGFEALEELKLTGRRAF